MRLTGNKRYRTNWRGKLILQVEEEGTGYESCGGIIDSYDILRWRDARAEDLSIT